MTQKCLKRTIIRIHGEVSDISEKRENAFAVVRIITVT
jgi:hypothetical protein